MSLNLYSSVEGGLARFAMFLKHCKVMARLIAVVANWWNIFCRLADPDARREATTSRPAYMSIMGRIVDRDLMEPVEVGPPLPATAEVVVEKCVRALLAKLGRNVERAHREDVHAVAGDGLRAGIEALGSIRSVTGAGG